VKSGKAADSFKPCSPRKYVLRAVRGVELMLITKRRHRSRRHNPALLGVSMSVSGPRFKFVLLVAAICALTLNVSAATKHKPKPAKQEQPAPPPAIVEVPAPAELTLEQKPAVPPKVTYQDRQLTIVAENSSLGDILRAVKTQTGAAIDLPAN